MVFIVRKSNYFGGSISGSPMFVYLHLGGWGGKGVLKQTMDPSGQNPKIRDKRLAPGRLRK